MDGSRSDPPSGRDPDAPRWSPQPLGLTVHALPDPAGVQRAMQVDPGRGRRTMALILLVCAMPVLMSYFLYYGVRPSARSNYGQLIEPMRPIPPLPARDLQRQVRTLQQLQGHWLLISVADGACNARCEQHLLLQRQLRESLGKEKERVVWVWLVADDTVPPATLLPALRQATVLHVARDDMRRWLEPQAGATLDDHLYVVDPQGHWMLRFPAELDLAHAASAKRDLDRLLRASAAWDKPATTHP